MPLFFVSLLPIRATDDGTINASIPILEWPMFQHDLSRTGFLNASSSSSVPKIALLWQYAIDSIDCSPVISDLNGDGKVEIVIGALAGVYCISHNGSLIWFYPTGSSDNFPTIADLYKLEKKEVLVSSNDGIIRCLNGTTGELVWASQCSGSGNWNDYPTVADLNGDGQPEIIAIAGTVNVFDSNGSKIWEKGINAGTLPAVADINKDGKLEIAFNTHGQLKVLSHDGEQLVYHGFGSGGGPMGVPTIANITGDGSLEIIIANHLGIFVFDSTGNILWEERSYDLRASSPAVADINGDGKPEIVAVSLDDGVVYSFDKDGNLLWDSSEGKLKTFSSPVIADIDGDGELEIVLGPDEGWISCFDSEGKKIWETYIGKDPVVETCDFSRSPAICDVNDDGILDIVVGSGDYLYVFTGTTETFDTTPPQITVISPKKTTYEKNASGVFFGLTFLINEPVSWMGYSLDDQANITIAGNTTLTGLPEGVHSIVVYATDVAGNKAASEPVYFVVDTTPPSISILSLKNETYATANIPLNLSVNEPVSWMGYSLDDQANITIAGNTTLTGLPEGSHYLTAYATDIYENTGNSEKIYFSINTQQSESSMPQPTNPPDQPSFTDPSLPMHYGYTIAIIIVMATAAATFLVYFRKIKKQTTKPKK